MKFIKRDGTEVPFNIDKILQAIDKAFLDEKKEKAPEWFKLKVKDYFDSYERAGVSSLELEPVQDTVENCLMLEGFTDVARSYILYRNRHQETRLIRERVEYMEQYAHSDNNAASASETDPNANMSIKNVANLEGEVYKTTNRKIQRYRMRKKLKELFPQYEQQYEKDLEHHIIYVHDEASSPVTKYYCQAVSLYPFLQNGSSGMNGLKTCAPKHLASFANQFNNLVFLLTAQCKGAVAFGGFFIAFNYYAVKDFGEGYRNRTEETASIHPKRTILETIHQYYQTIIYGINEPAGNRSFQSPFTNFSYYDRNYYKALFDEFRYPDGTKPLWEDIDFLQRDFMKWFNRERTRTLLTFPVETMALLTDGKKFLDEEYKDFNAQMYAEGHSFFTYISDNPNALASCCRLRNEITENIFSFTNGLTGIQTGSANVISLNFNRIIQDWAKENRYSREYLKEKFFIHKENFTKYLTEILERVYAYHTAYKTMLYESEEAGMLTASNAGYISMSKLYSTIGVNGVNEAAEFIGLKCSYNEDYKNFCRLITGTISQQNKLHSTRRFMFNQEFVPAEGLSSKNCNWDRSDGYWIPEGRILYNSYFYLADDEHTSVPDKFRLHGREFTELLDGGVGLHCNLKEHLSKEQYLKLLDHALKCGTSYFTYNIPNSQCTDEKCGHIVKRPLDTCPICGARMKKGTRVVGYIRFIEDYDLYRQREAEDRYYAGAESIKL